MFFLDRRPHAKCEEKGKSYVLDQSGENPRHEVMMYHVDKGIVSGADANTVLKCDYALLIKDFAASCEDRAGTVILIELKGGDGNAKDSKHRYISGCSGGTYAKGRTVEYL